MTTPNTLKASLTADVGTAQVQIQRLIKTVEEMGKTVVATSATGQRAFKAEADEVTRLVRELGASEKQLNRLTAARTGFSARVQSESMAAAGAARDMANAHGSAATSVVKGLASIAAEAKVTSGGLKDILSGVGNLAFAFGPTGAFVSAIAIGASAVVGFFTAAREEMAKTQREFTVRVADMQQAGNASGLRDEAKKIFDELQPLQARLALAQDKNFGGLTVGEGLRARRVLPGQIEALQGRFNAARDAALNPGAPDIARSGLVGVTVTANAPGRRSSGGGGRAAQGGTASAVEAQDGMANMVTGTTALADAMRAANEAFTAQHSDGLFSMIAADTSKPITAMQILRAEIAETTSALTTMGSTARFSLEQGLGAGLDALITGQGNAIRNLKRAAAEPIVAQLRMNAIESFSNAAKFAMSPATWGLVPVALASGAKNTVGAMAVARIGGISGGGGEGAGGGAGGGDSSFGRNAGLPGDGLSSARNDRPIRIEMIVISQSADGRELARTRQMIQRLDDRNQPIRVTL
jgi:hypothetical protein